MGLSKAQARKLLGHHPWALAVDPLAQALPVLECLRLVDFSQEQLRGLVRQNPRLLVADVEGHLLPLVSYLAVSARGRRQGLHFSPAGEAESSLFSGQGFFKDGTPKCC